MADLSIFFEAPDIPEITGASSPYTIVKKTDIHAQRFPDWKNADIALIGVSDDRGAGGDQGNLAGIEAVREKLYNLTYWNEPIRVCDLGNLAPGPEPEDTILRLKEVCTLLMEQNTLPLIIGGSHDLTLGQFGAYELIEKPVTVVNVDARIDLHSGPGASADQSFLHKIFTSESSFLFDYTHAAVQSYLVPEAFTQLIEKMHFRVLRLGKMRDDFEETEPFFRAADLLSFDLCALRAGDAPASKLNEPFGLTAEEACRLMFYTGIGGRVSSAGIYGYDASADPEGIAASVAAVMLWYFIDGFSRRADSEAFRSDDYLTYLVPVKEDPKGITFYKSKKTGKWWLEVPHPSESLERKPEVIPCSYRDYEAAVAGDIPERWLHTYAKLV